METLSRDQPNKELHLSLKSTTADTEGNNEDQNEEEETTLSWTSSMHSMSPDNPLYQQQLVALDCLTVPGQNGAINHMEEVSGTNVKQRTSPSENQLPNHETSIGQFSDSSNTENMSGGLAPSRDVGESTALTDSPTFESYPLDVELDVLHDRDQRSEPTSQRAYEHIQNQLDSRVLSHEHRRKPSTIPEQQDEDLGDSLSALELPPKTLHRPLSRSVSASALSSLTSISAVSGASNVTKNSSTPSLRRTSSAGSFAKRKSDTRFEPIYYSSRWLEVVSRRLLSQHYAPFAAATWIGFWALLLVTCANYVLTPMRDAIALQIGVAHVPKLTLASTVLAFVSSVPIGWLFEAPDPSRRRLWKRMGLTRGETQGSSLALFYRCFALILISYSVGFTIMDYLQGASNDRDATKPFDETHASSATTLPFLFPITKTLAPLARAIGIGEYWPPSAISILSLLGKALYVAFFLVVHLMKLHSLSLVWGVTTEAMEYEEVARRSSKTPMESTQTRIQRLALVGFGGTMGGILGSALASTMAQSLKLPGLLVLAAVLLEISAELSIELGRIMQKHWEEQQLFQSSNDLASLDSSMKRSSSLGSMKRVASGNSLNRIKSTPDLSQNIRGSSNDQTGSNDPNCKSDVNDNTFMQRLVRGITTILRSRLLMAVFTYNALYASTTVLLSFQRAVLVANRNTSTSTEADTAFLANVNMASSISIFALQASGLGAYVAHKCGPRKTLALMPLIRLAGVIALASWHRISSGKPPNLLVFLVVDECTKIMNLAVAKPVRESLWRGLSNEARYEAKPIVDTLANRWGGGSAAFLVSFISKLLDLLGVEPGDNGVRMLFGFPPILFLCLIIASWWTVVSADLGTIRYKIDLELKKRQ